MLESMPPKPKPLIMRSPDRKLGRWTDLPVGWTQEEQPEGSDIWRRYRPLPKGGLGEVGRVKRKLDRRFAEPSMQVFRQVVAEPLEL